MSHMIKLSTSYAHFFLLSTSRVFCAVDTCLDSSKFVIRPLLRSAAVSPEVLAILGETAVIGIISLVKMNDTIPFGLGFTCVFVETDGIA